MTETIYVVGHKNPDNDAISAAIGFAAFKNAICARDGIDAVYKPVRLGPLPVETAFNLERYGVEEPELIERVDEGDKVALVDHNEVRQSVDGIEDAEIVEIVDHHRIGGMVTAAPIPFTNRPTGSTAGIVTSLFRAEDLPIPQPIAACLLSACLTDTVILKSPTTTPFDHNQVAYLSTLLSVDPVEFGMELFRKRGGESEMDIDKLVGADSKEFAYRDKVVYIAQRETVDLKAVLDREDEIREYMKGLCESKGYEFAILMATDILAEGTQLLVEGNTAAVDAIFDITCQPGGVWMPGVLSRKKQIAAAVLGA